MRVQGSEFRVQEKMKTDLDRINRIYRMWKWDLWEEGMVSPWK